MTRKVIIGGFTAPPVHDPCVLAALFDPAVLTFRPAAVNIETAGTYTSGMTVVDFDGEPDPHHRVAVAIDTAGFWTRVTDAVAALPVP